MNFLVLVTTAVGYYMAVRTSFDWVQLVHTLLGTALTAPPAPRRQPVHRAGLRRPHAPHPQPPLVAGRIAPSEALLLGLACGIAGVL